MQFIFSIIVLFVLFFNVKAFGFAENVTHGYTNCMTCHYSPAGGDLLNEYGRSLSSELMSTWSHKGVEGALGGLIKESKWAKVGGDLRTLQSYLETPVVSDRKLFLMQNNVELGFKFDKFMLVGAFGTSEGPSGIPGKGDFLSERHYLMYEVSPAARVRVGKFRINYGVNDPNHNRPIKRELGFGSFTERYNTEYSHYFEQGDAVFTYSLGRVDQARSSRDERSGSTKLGYYIGDNSKVGASFLYGETPQARRHLVGTHGILSLTEKAYALYELDYENKKSSNIGQTEKFLGHMRVGYEFFKGFKGYGLFDYLNEVGNVANRYTAPGLGVQWLPFPHLELQMEYQAQDREVGPGVHFGFVMLHVYY